MITKNKLMNETLIDYAKPCMNAEKALKEAHWATLEHKYDQAIVKTLEALVSVSIMHAALLNMKKE